MTTTNRYANGKIYRLVNSVDDEFYVGSTCDALHKRLYNHKQEAKHQPRPVHHHCNDIGWENVSIVLVEEYACANKMELERQERYWIEEMKPSLNRNMPARTRKEYFEENKYVLVKKERERKAKYRAENADKVRETQAKYRAKNTEKRREASLKYYSENRDAIHARSRENYAQNKEIFAERQKRYNSKRVQCPHCNEEMNCGSLTRHIKRKHPNPS